MEPRGAVPRRRASRRVLSDVRAVRLRRALEATIGLAGLLMFPTGLVLFALPPAHFVFWLVTLLVLLLGAITAGAGFVRVVNGDTLRLDFEEAMRVRRTLLRDLARRLDGGRLEEHGSHTARVTGRRDGLEVTVTAWVQPFILPDTDEVTWTVGFASPWGPVLIQRELLLGGASRLVVRGAAAPPVDDALTAALVTAFERHHVEGPIELGPRGLVARTPGHTRQLLQPRQQEELLACLLDLARRLGAPRPVEVTASARESAVICPFCREVAQEGREDCGACGTPHHAACLVEHGGCTVVGCRSARGSRRARVT
ncbi:MAG: hypothetical protein KF878_22560 [Planctomycetes bacterium]|nr:hypothetical protein [Planctomycetota bacterium]